MDGPLETAIAMFRAGRFHEAAAGYRSILIQEPTHAIALLHLGMLQFQDGAFEESISLIRRSIEIDPGAAGSYYTLAQVLAAANQHAAAIESLRNALRLRPDWPEALIGIGAMLERSGQLDAAESAYRRAVEIKSDAVEAWVNLGNVLQRRGQFPEAIETYRKALSYQPRDFDAHNNLATALRHSGDAVGAIDEYRTALEVNPQSAIAWQNLGTTQLEVAHTDDALDSFQRALQINPDLAEAWLGYGNTLRELRRYPEAVDAFKQAIKHRPNYVEAFHNLGNAQHAAGNRVAAVEAYRRAIALGPTFLRSYINLGSLLKTAGKLDEAEELLRKALTLQPHYHVTLCNLGNVIKEAGRIEEAIDLFRQAMEQNPADVLTHSNLAYAMYFDPRCSSEEILSENQRFDAMHAVSLAPNVAASSPADPRRRPRVGYFGAHFRTHCQSFFTVPLFEQHDRESFELFCYADEMQSDAITDRLKKSVEHWRDVSRLSDADAADLIRRDEIDILIDLTMHMGQGRPLLIARKPARIQAAWLAYPGTTGLSAMDYRLTDPQLDPPTGGSDGEYSERSYRLRDTFWCYDPLSEEPLPGPLPADQAGFITFGCLNNFCKVTEQMLFLWTRVLRTVERSQLLMLSSEGAHREWILQYFSWAGVNRERIRFQKYRPREQYLASYHQIDIGLDTIPYNGHTTSLDSFWMGVPVVTRVGRTVVGRAGLSQLTNLGLSELIAFDDDAFVSIVTKLANDRTRLRELRSGLRERMRLSPLMDHARFARSMEEFFRFACYADSR